MQTQTTSKNVVAIVASLLKHEGVNNKEFQNSVFLYYLLSFIYCIFQAFALYKGVTSPIMGIAVW